MSTDNARSTASTLPELPHSAYRVRGVDTAFREPAPWSAARLRAVLEQQHQPLTVRADDRGLTCTLDNREVLRATPAPSHFHIRTCAECGMFEREHWVPMSCRRFRDPNGDRSRTYLVDVRLATTIEVTASDPASVADLLRALAGVGVTLAVDAPGLDLAEFSAATLDLGSVSLRQIDGQDTVLTCRCGKPLTGSLAFLRDSHNNAECPECATRRAYPYDEPPF